MADLIQLSQAIDEADANALRRIMKILCKNSETTAKQAADHLLVTPVQSNHKRKASADKDATAFKKQKAEEEDLAARFAECTSCRQIFDITKNDEKSCKTHPGPLEPDTDFFEDDDTITWGVIPPPSDWAEDWRYEEWPEGFIWECCGRRGNEKYCAVRKHVYRVHAKVMPGARESEGSVNSEGSEKSEETDEDEY